ncbi:SusD/RagB family nutrient-binding outer membrane lipoprotein [Reichenbachiella sp. MALMAid0571]|uniref:SusD/RagB family nutrient-binding outer membrane lipoprotein n=1 Tax=Reichenbachiella sp. MALMAid0571 TaxID=3143939 RepID=UPI0032E01C83
MYFIKNKILIVVGLMLTMVFSCKDLDELNINPNGPDPEDTDPYLLMATVLSGAGTSVVNLGYGDLAGVMQHTQKDGWGGSHNSYEWTSSSQGWNGYYRILGNNQDMFLKSEALGYEFAMGVGLVMKSYVFGLITDLYGDAPYSEALLGDDDAYREPKFDRQQDILNGIFADLETANTLLSKSVSEYNYINKTQDIIYEGSPSKWRKFANSLALRYYMRLSVKDPGTAQTGIAKIVGDPTTYPIITSANDDANMDYVGANSSNSWPKNYVFDTGGGSDFRRVKMCATLVDAMKLLNDPRLDQWAARVEIPIEVNEDENSTDEITDGIRYVSRNLVDDYEADFGIPLNTSTDFVGMPPAALQTPSAFNMSPDLNQASTNPHVSWVNAQFTEASGDNLKARLITAAEVNFILAEAALNGWIGNAEEYYNAGIQASFEAWGIGDEYDDYMTETGVAYDATQAQIINQKWISSWAHAAESWFDYRRTGLPDLQTGQWVKRDAIPVKFYYPLDEEFYNQSNAEAAIANLEKTTFNGADPQNSAWSKPWIIQGTGKPW